ncbi:LITAF-like zinc ribbon domain-containing protein [Sporodiniella umbellata]|nr:LITAF-like zinc ribbon domain-containing protein [Sporodiniella umbellata]
MDAWTPLSKHTPSIYHSRRAMARQQRIELLVNHPHLPDFETQTVCEQCEKYVLTRIRYRNGSLVWLAALILLLTTVILCWLPFYVKYLKDVAHYCPRCGQKIGTCYRI